MPHDLPFASGPTVANAAATILGGLGWWLLSRLLPLRHGLRVSLETDSHCLQPLGPLYGIFSDTWGMLQGTASASGRLPLRLVKCLLRCCPYLCCDLHLIGLEQLLTCIPFARMWWMRWLYAIPLGLVQ